MSRDNDYTAFVEVPQLWVEHPDADRRHERPRVFVELPVAASPPREFTRITLRVRADGVRPVNVHLRRPDKAVVAAGPAWDGGSVFALDLARPGLFEVVPVNDRQREKLDDAVGDFYRYPGVGGANA